MLFVYEDYLCAEGHDFVDCIISNATVCELCQGTIWNQCKQCRGCRILCHHDCNPRPQQTPEPLQQSSVHFSVKKTSLDSLKSFQTEPGKRASVNVSYITDRLIDVSFSSSTQESVYTASLDSISNILRRRHGEHYAIFNISERRYDISAKNEKVLDLGWPDHLAPPLDRLISTVRTIDCWFAMDPNNVAVLHCKGGRSRTAIIVAAFIQYSKHMPSPQTALGWFSLRQYYESRLAGKLQPSQRRYVKYFGDLLERKFKLENRVLKWEEFVLSGFPVAQESGCQIYFRIYQGYQLVHTTDAYVLSPGEERIVIKPAVDLNLVGDTLVKCCFTGNNGQQRDTIFRCQFHMDAIQNDQLVLQKAELDGAVRNKFFPENCFVEINFSPAGFGLPSHAMDAEVGGILNANELYRGPKHVPGPLDGNPYAQIDHSMKLRARQMADNNRIVDGKPSDLGKGIKDLDDLLGELGHLTQAYQSRKTKTDMNSNNVVIASPRNIDMSSNGVDDSSSKDSSSEISSVDGESRPSLPPRSSSYSAVTRLHVSGVGKGAPRGFVSYDDHSKLSERDEFVFPVDNEMSSSSFADEVFEAVSPTVHDLLNELNRSALNSHTRSYPKKHNASSYDNYDTSGTESNDGDSSGADSYRSGMVANHVKQFNELWSCPPDPSKVASGVPLPGLVQGVDIEDRIFKYNTRSVAPGHRGPQNEQLYLSGSPPTRVVYEVERTEPNFDPRMLTFEELNIHRSRNGGYGYPIDDQRVPEMDVIHKPPPEFLDVSVSTYDGSDGHKELESPEVEVRPGSDSAYGDSSSLSTPVASQSQNEKVLKGTDIVDTPNGNARHTNSQLSDEDPGYMKIDDYPTQRREEITEEHIGVATVEATHQRPVLDLDILDIPLTTRPAYKPGSLLQTTSPTSAPPKVTVTDTSSPQIDAATLIQQSKELLASLQRARNDELREKARTIDTSKPLSVSTSPPQVRHTPPKLDLSKVDSPRSTEDRFNRQSPGSASDGSSGIHYVDSEMRMRSQEEVATGREQFAGPETPRAIRNSESISSASQSPRSPEGGSSPSPTRATLRRGRLRRMGSSESSTNPKDLFPEVARYPHIKFDHITLSYWYKPNISREDAINLLKDKDPGAFVVRDSKSYGGAFGLAVKVATPPLGVLQQAGGDLSKIDLENELVRHFLIEPARQGVRLKGSANEPYFPSLVALIYQHSITKMALPVNLKLPVRDLVVTPSDQPDGKTMSEQELLSKGVGCDVVYLRAIHVEGLSGEGAVALAMDQMLNMSDTQTATVVNFKVDQEGITLTDNERRLFFRKHFQLKHVLYCTVDPQNRRWNLSRFLPGSAYEAGCFALVVSRPNRPADHDCHVFAELNADQPSASVVVSFVDRALKLLKN